MASRVESAPIELPKEPAAPVVSERGIVIASQESNQGSGHDKREEFQPPPPLEFEPTIDPATFNQPTNDIVGKPVVAKSPKPKEKEAVKPKPVATDAIHWTELSYDLGLQGFAQAIATNSVVGNYEQNHLQLFLTPDFMKFVNPENQDEICQAIASKLGLSLILDLQTQDKLDAETPSETRLRKQQEHRQVTIESIKQEQSVKKLQRAFGAELIEASVQLISETKEQN